MTQSLPAGDDVPCTTLDLQFTHEVRAFLLRAAVPCHAELGASVALEATKRALFTRAAATAVGSHEPAESTDLRQRLAAVAFLVEQGDVLSAIGGALRLIGELRLERDLHFNGGAEWLRAFGTEMTLACLVRSAIGRPTAWTLVDRVPTVDRPLADSELAQVTLEDAEAVLARVPGKARTILHATEFLYSPEGLHHAVLRLAQDVDERGVTPTSPASPPAPASSVSSPSVPVPPSTVDNEVWLDSRDARALLGWSETKFKAWSKREAFPKPASGPRQGHAWPALQLAAWADAQSPRIVPKFEAVSDRKRAELGARLAASKARVPVAYAQADELRSRRVVAVGRRGSA